MLFTVGWPHKSITGCLTLISLCILVSIVNHFILSLLLGIRPKNFKQSEEGLSPTCLASTPIQSNTLRLSLLFTTLHSWWIMNLRPMNIKLDSAASMLDDIRDRSKWLPAVWKLATTPCKTSHTWASSPSSGLCDCPTGTIEKLGCKYLSAC